MHNSVGLLEQMKEEIRRVYQCEPTHTASAIVMAPFAEGVSDNGRFEVFGITGHQHAKRVYAWTRKRKNGAGVQVVTVLGTPPVDSVSQAIRAYLTREIARGAAH
jgi:hypothetical protein